jgi:Trk K+ transport system NAD-binding subunit
MELGHGMRLAEIDVPAALAGQTLRDLQLRQEYGVEVLYILKGPYQIRKFAAPDVKLESGDRILIVAEAETLRAFLERTHAEVSTSAQSSR